MTRKKNHHLTIIIDSNKNHQWILKLGKGEFEKQHHIDIVWKYLSQDTNFKGGKIITLQWRNLASTALTNWWRVTSAVIKHFNVIYPLIKRYKMGISLPWYSSHDIHCNPSLSHNKASDKPTLNILQNTCPVLLKNVKVLKNKGSEQLLQLRGA